MIEIPSWVGIVVVGGILSWGAYVTTLAFSNKGGRAVLDERAEALAEEQGEIKDALKTLIAAQTDASIAAKAVAVTVDHLTEKVGNGFEGNTSEHGEIETKIDRNLTTVTDKFVDHERRLALLEAQVVGHAVTDAPL